MSRNETEKLRTVALVGHGAVGKTTLAEALLVATGAITSRARWRRATPCATSTRRKRSWAIR